jgi:hypothetical protein
VSANSEDVSTHRQQALFSYFESENPKHGKAGQAGKLKDDPESGPY